MIRSTSFVLALCAVLLAAIVMACGDSDGPDGSAERDGAPDLVATDSASDATAPDAPASDMGADTPGADAPASDMGADTPGADADTSSTPDGELSDASATLFTDVMVVENPRSTLSALVEVTTSEATEVIVRFASEGGAPQQTTASPLGLTHEVTVVGMRSNQSYALEVVAETEDGTRETASPINFQTGDLPIDMPAFEAGPIDSDNVPPGLTVVGISELNRGGATNSSVIYFAVDGEGEVVWYYAEGRGNNDRVATQLDDGNLLISVLDGFRIITPGGETIQDFVGTPDRRLHHDALVLDNGNLLGLSQETRTLDLPELGEVELTGDVVIELTPTDEIVWEWSTFDHLDTTRLPGELSQNPGSDGGLDWTHGNALVHLEADDSLLISLRHQNWVIKVDRASGDILWRLGPDGDFSLEGPGEWFYAQHAPELAADGTILIYDNGNERPTDDVYSRAVIYSLDELAMTAEQVWSYQTERYTGFLGDADRVGPNNVLVCAGGEGATSQAQVIEVTRTDPAEPVWELTAEGYIYRATRLSSF